MVGARMPCRPTVVQTRMVWCVVMRIRRGLLFWGLVLIPLGGIPLLVRAGYLDEDVLANAWQLWPLILVGLGLALLLGRSRAGLVGTVIVALTIGGLAGAALAAGPSWVGTIGDCAPVSADASQADADGSLSGASTLTVELDCGTFDLVTEPGAAWRTHVEYRGPEPRVQASSSMLTLRGPRDPGSHRQEWQVSVGADVLRAVDLTINAAASTAALDGANLGSVRADLNAGDLRLDGSSATIAEIDLSVNAGRIRATLGAGSTTGSLSANAGAIELCVPPEAALRFDVNDQLTFATNLKSSGLSQDGETWTREGPGDLIDLDIEGNAASFTLDPDGGCD